MPLSIEEREALVRRLLEIDIELEAAAKAPVVDWARHSRLRCQRVALTRLLWEDNRDEE